jgi:hypothetical protein
VKPVTGTFECPLCQHPISFFVYNLPEPVKAEALEKAAERAKHEHWCEVHRICAKCGEYVKSNELGMAANDGSITIHKGYTDGEYHEVQSGNIGYTLIVHKRCIAA